MASVDYFQEGEQYHVRTHTNTIKTLTKIEFQLLSSIIKTDTSPEKVNAIKSIISGKPYITTLPNKNGQYVGEVLDGRPHGKGEITKVYPGGTHHFKGTFKKGNKDGPGILTITNGSLEKGMYSQTDNPRVSEYRGNWVNNKFNGTGISYLPCGIVSKCKYTDGKKHGPGTLENNNNCVSVNWDMGKLSGAVTFENGDQYIGDFDFTSLLSIKNGKGTLRYANGDLYVGNFWNGKKRYYGIMTYANGDVYTGSWLDNMRQGKGILTKADGTVYDGVFQEDKFITLVDV